MKRILLICANQRLVLRAQIGLLRSGIMAEVASTFRRGLAVAAARPPSAIVLDEQIPGFDCTQLATVIKAAQATAPLPVLVLAQDDRIASTLRAAQLHEVASVRSGWPPEVPIFEALCQHGLV